MKKILVGLILGIFFGLNLFANDVDLGIELSNKGDYIKANELLKKACADGNAIGCSNLRISYIESFRFFLNSFSFLIVNIEQLAQVTYSIRLQITISGSASP